MYISILVWGWHFLSFPSFSLAILSCLWHGPFVDVVLLLAILSCSLLSCPILPYPVDDLGFYSLSPLRHHSYLSIYLLKRKGTLTRPFEGFELVSLLEREVDGCLKCEDGRDGIGRERRAD